MELRPKGKLWVGWMSCRRRKLPSLAVSSVTNEFGREDPRSAHSDCVLVKLPVIAKYQARTGLADYSEPECEGV
jgi:hypothetical protein